MQNLMSSFANGTVAIMVVPMNAISLREMQGLTPTQQMQLAEERSTVYVVDTHNMNRLIRQQDRRVMQVQQIGNGDYHYKVVVRSLADADALFGAIVERHAA